VTVPVRPLVAEDRGWVDAFVAERWDAETVVGHGVVFHPAELPGFVAEVGGERVGLLTYDPHPDDWEIVTIDSDRPGTGVGTALLDAVRQAASSAGCRRLWLVTTNDNVDALRFYQRRGFELAALHRRAVEGSRRLKPEIPSLGLYGIPIRDELELDLPLSPGAAGPG
jgi:DNA-3-methyladenine glycosylase I